MSAAYRMWNTSFLEFCFKHCFESISHIIIILGYLSINYNGFDFFIIQKEGKTLYLKVNSLGGVANFSTQFKVTKHHSNQLKQLKGCAEWSGKVSDSMGDNIAWKNKTYLLTEWLLSTASWLLSATSVKILINI